VSPAKSSSVATGSAGKSQSNGIEASQGGPAGSSYSVPLVKIGVLRHNPQRRFRSCLEVPILRDDEPKGGPGNAYAAGETAVDGVWGGVSA
jgi:hypothetical protein